MGQPHILILGPPGAGKGTQSGNIAEEYGIEHVTTGDALRGNKDMDISDMDTEYDTPRAYMEAGDLVPDAVVNAIVEEALSAADGFVLDGYPRNLEQAEELSGMTDIDVVLSLEVSREELVDRLSGRRVCDGCGGELEQREDDRPEAVENRLDVFDENTTPVIEQYQDHEGFVAIDGEQPPAEVWGAIDSAVRGRADVSE